MRNFILFIFILLPIQLFATREDSLVANIKVSCFEKLNENPLLSNRNIESDVLCESACLVPCSHEEREKAFLKNIDGFPHNNVKSVRDYTQYFTYYKAENTELLFAIGNEYFPVIEKILNENNLPKELKYLPAAISALNPYYHGENGGKGVWQLSYAHATRYGLTIDNFVDERLNLFKSTQAASLYLKDLYAEYKNWPTAILAFSSSPALVSKAVSRANKNDFEGIVEHMPSNYQNNYYIFRALLFVGENWDREKMPSVTPSLLPPTDAVITNQKLHIGQVSEVLQIPVDILAELNAPLRKGIINEGNTLYLPLGFANNFRVKQQDIAIHKTNIYFEMPKTLAQVNLTPLNAGSSATMGPTEQKTVTIKKYHVVKSGENLSKIAQKYRTSVNQLKSWNGLSSTKINVGKKLVVKVTKKVVEIPAQEDVSVRQNVTIEDNNEVEFGEGSTSPEPNNTPVIKPNHAPKPPTPTASYTYYTVKSGDTLYSIGKKHGVPYTKIKEWNGLKSDTVKIGQKLKIKK
ncbi:MAG TPA: LysM peptidoglycan-binding domain-containing protein [Bacteroidia bacterium]